MGKEVSELYKRCLDITRQGEINAEHPKNPAKNYLRDFWDKGAILSDFA